MSDPHWTTITPEDIYALDVAPLIEAARTAVLDEGQPDPLPPTIADVTGLVRGYVAGGGYLLAAGETVPNRLKTAALDIATYRILARIRRAGRRWKERHDAAMGILRDVQAGEFDLPLPLEPEGASGRPMPALIGGRTNQFTRQSQDGI